MWESITTEAGPKAVAYLATLAYVGAVTAAALSRQPDGASLWPVCARVARVAAFAGVLALAARGWAHAATVADGVPDRETLTRVLLDSRWGGRWQWQCAAAVGALGVAIGRALPRGGWAGPALVAAGWCVATPLLGHGAGSDWQHGVHTLHLLVTGMWLGTVGVLALASGRSAGVSAEALAAVVGRFSPTALACASMAAVSGAVLGVTYVGTLADLFSSPYGRWLLLKLATVGGVAACGLSNWRRARDGRPPSPALLRAEGLAAIAAAIVTAVLTEAEHPAL